MPIAPPEQVLNFLKRAHDELQPLSTRIDFSKDHPLHRHIVALYGSIVELTGSLILLTDHRLISGVPVLLRSVLEAYVDLYNLSENPTYAFSLQLSYLKEWLNILHEASSGKNEYLTTISKAPDLAATISAWQQKKRGLKDKGYKSLNVENKFQRAGMEKEYRSIYNSLCSDSHNNLRSLIGRHVERKESDFEVVFYKAYTPEDSAHYIGTAAELLVRASEKVHAFFDSPVRKEVESFRIELNELKGGD